MKPFRKAPAAVTSLPTAPRDEERSRVRTYTITMSIRMLCFLLTVIVTPYSWYTWVFAAGAIFLPYIAVVMANAVQARGARPIESPERMLETTRPPVDAEPEAPRVIRIDEKPGSAEAPASDREGPSAPDDKRESA